MSRTIILRSDRMGEGDDALGAMLMPKFLTHLNSADSKPDNIVLYNSGVKLLVEDTPSGAALDALFNSGVDLIACGTCVTHFNIADKIATGRVSGMQEIVAIINGSDTVVTI
jgi:selenium metabolism protein YedF